MLKFPALNSTRVVKLFQEPVRQEKEDDETFKLRLEEYEERKVVEVEFKLMSASSTRQHQLAYHKILREEMIRLKDLPKDDPVKIMGTDRGEEEFRAAHHAVLQACLVSVRGVELGDRDLGQIKEPRELIEALEFIRWIPLVAAVCRSQQEIGPIEKKSSGPSSGRGARD